VKGVLREILAFFPISVVAVSLAFFPISGHAIDGMKDQSPIFMNKFFYRLVSRSRIHNNTLFRVSITRYSNEDA
jgi:hypothetical protein